MLGRLASVADFSPICRAAEINELLVSISTSRAELVP